MIRSIRIFNGGEYHKYILHFVEDKEEYKVVGRIDISNLAYFGEWAEDWLKRGELPLCATVL